MNKTYLLGIDIGTSSIKVVLTDEQGTKLFSHCQQNEIMQPYPGFVEQDAMAAWWTGACNGIKACIEGANIDASRILGICCSGMVPSFCPLDENGEPVRPAILYRDNRAIKQAKYLSDKLNLKFTLQDVMPKILWLKENEPESYAKTRMVLNPHSFIAYKLTGQYSVDTDIATIFGHVYDNEQRQWQNHQVTEMGLDPSLLPPIFGPMDIVGNVTAEAARITGLVQGTPVIAGTGDSYTVLVGTGIVEANEGIIYLGTAATFLGLECSLDELRGRTLFSPGGARFIANVLTGGEIVRWYISSMLFNAQATPDDLESVAKHIPPGADGLYTLPHLLGERTPTPDPLATGALFGLTNAHTTAHVYRSLMEGVAFALRESYEAAYMPLKRVVVGGGGGKSALWRQMLADILRLDLEYIPSADNALGTAFLAGISLGLYENFSTIKNEWLKEKQIIRFNPDTANEYDKHFAFYKELNTIIRPAYKLHSKVFPDKELT